MKLTIPMGSKITQTNDQNTIEIKVLNTKYWIQGEQLPTKLWNAYLTDPESNYKEILRRNVTTSSFALFSELVLRTPFPFNGKKAENSLIIKKFIKKITKNTNGNNKKRNIRTKSSKLQSSRKRRA